MVKSASTVQEPPNNAFAVNYDPIGARVYGSLSICILGLILSRFAAMDSFRPQRMVYLWLEPLRRHHGDVCKLGLLIVVTTRHLSILQFSRPFLLVGLKFRLLESIS